MRINLNAMLDFMTRIAPGHGSGTFTLNIGDIRETLTRRRMVLYSLASKSPRVDTLFSYAWKRTRGRMRLHPTREPNPHIVVVGMSGYGKSTLLRHMVGDIRNGGVGVIVFDAHNEHEAAVSSAGGTVYDAACVGLNIFELDGVSVAQRISDLTALFKDVYRLGHVQASKLSECLWYTYRKAGAASRSDMAVVRVPSIGDLVAELRVFLNNARTSAERNTITHLLSRMSLLGYAGFSKGTVSVGQLMGGVSSFSLAGLKSPEAQMIYIGELLRRLYASMKGNDKERGIAMYIVLDEAQFLMDTSEAGGRFISRLISEGRKYGVGVIIATHMASQLDRRVMANASTFITFYPREPSEINYVANLVTGGNPEAALAVKERMSRMGRNEAMVVSGSVRNATLVATKDFRDLNHGDAGVISDLKRQMESILNAATRPIEYGSVVSGKPEAEAAIKGLIAAGKLERFVDELGGGKVWLMKKKGSVSAEHEVCVRKVAGRLVELGVRHYIVDNSNGPDIVAFINGEKVAIEYETGRKRADSTAGMLKNRRNEYARTVVFVNSSAHKFYSDNFSVDGVEVHDIADLSSYDIGVANGQADSGVPETTT